MVLVCPLFLHQGDMGPVGEMGLPGPSGLKVILHKHSDGNCYIQCILYSHVWTDFNSNSVLF